MILGKTHLPELAIHGFTESKTFGDHPQPLEPGTHHRRLQRRQRAPLLPPGWPRSAHASDGAGSIRYPAAHNCGLFGLKPQRDRVPIDAEHWYGLSVNGCVSRTVADTALFLDAVTGDRLVGHRPASAGAALRRVGRQPAGSLRIAVTLKTPRAIAPPKLTDESTAKVEETAELLRSLGHDVEWQNPEWGNDR